MGFAGVWDGWRSPEAERIESCSIMTTEANQWVTHLHNRMPLILPPDHYEGWLTGTVAEASEMMKPLPSPELEAYPVSTLVNKPENDDARCIDRVA